jgi:hypothetical protein
VTNEKMLDRAKPIFLVGCPSSGTTLLQSILNTHSNISCGPETDFLVGLLEVTSGKYQKKLKHYGFDERYWCQRVAEFFETFKLDYAQKQGKKRWADKSPSYTSHLDFIYRLFPECQIIHVVRDGRDVVMSHRERWGYKSAIKATWLWRDYVRSARDFGKKISNAQYLEVRYENLVQNPEDTIKSLFEYLSEPWESQVLDYKKSPNYKEDSKYAQYTEERRRESQDRSLIYKARIGTAKNLDPFLKGLMHFQSSVLLRDLGY